MRGSKGISRYLGMCVFSATLIAGAIIDTGPADAAKQRNESRWFLQNVCLANATQLLGRSDWKDYDKEAKAARKRLKSRGVPESHLKEMEQFATNAIRSTTTAQNVHEGPQVCIQWYKT